jgi:iron complex outermembrane receptor protein
VDDSEIRYRDRWTQLDALWTPNANVEWRTRVYQIDSQRDWRNAEAYVYNRATGLIDRSGNTEITHNQDQTGLTSTLRGNGGWPATSRWAWMPTARTSSTPTTPMPAARARSIRSIRCRAVRQRCAEPAALPQPCRAVRAVRGRPAGAERALVGAGWAAPRRARIDRTDLISGQNAFSKTYSSTGWRAGTVLRCSRR